MPKIDVCTLALNTLADTERFCVALAGQLRAGDIVLLTGDLAVGKTASVKAIVRALGSDDEASSPTYAIGQHYRTRQGLPILHIDTYRLKSPAEFFDSGLQDYFEPSIVLIEWGELLADALESCWHLALELDPAVPEGRTLRLGIQGAVGRERAETVCQTFNPPPCHAHPAPGH